MSHGIQPEILATFEEIFHQYGDLEEYLHAIVTRHLSGDGYTSEDDNDLGFDLAHLDRDTLLSFLEAQNLRVEAQSAPVRVPANLSRNNSLDYELDAAIALSLEEVEEEDDASTDEQQDTPQQNDVVISDDDIDPGAITLEESQTLEEASGTESRGLFKEFLDTFPVQKLKAKSGWFSSNKSDPEGCPICLTEYEVDNELLTLPCLHLYHNSCIKEWLEDKKTCPICHTDITVPQA